MKETLSAETLRNYGFSWKYLKPLLSDITNVERTIQEINDLKFTSKNRPLTLLVRKNYVCAVMHQLRDNITVLQQYQKHLSEIRNVQKKDDEKQKGTELMREKLKDLDWNDIIKFKNQILKSVKVSDENKLLIRLYTELDYPVRNDFLSIRVFIDEGRPIDYEGNCIMLTRKPLVIKHKKKIVIKKSEPIVIDDCDISTAVIYPVRNMIWLTDFKTSKKDGTNNIIQSIPNDLATDLINYCVEQKTNILYNISSYCLSKRISDIFYQVSKRKIGINVMRHLKIMYEYKDVPFLDARKQAADKMGHSVNMQERYRIKLG